MHDRETEMHLYRRINDGAEDSDFHEAIKAHDTHSAQDVEPERWRDCTEEDKAHEGSS